MQLIGKPFLDCGAFTFSQKGVFPFDSYLAFVLRNHHRFCRIALPDVIGDAAQSFENYKKFLQKLDQFNVLDKIKDKLVWTYHLTSNDPKTLANMISLAKDYSLTWAAAGGLVTPRIPAPTKIAFLRQMRKVKEENNFKLHVWGTYRYDYVIAAHADSSDTVSPFRLAKYNCCLSFRPPHVVDVPSQLHLEGTQVAVANSINALLQFERWINTNTPLKDYRIFVVYSGSLNLPPFLLHCLENRLLISFAALI